MLGWTSAFYFCAALLSLSECRSLVTNTLGSSSSSGPSDSRYSSSFSRSKKIKYIPAYFWSSSSSNKSSSDAYYRPQKNITFSASEKSRNSKNMILIKIPKKIVLSFPNCRYRTSNKKRDHCDCLKSSTKSYTTNSFVKNTSDIKLKYKKVNSLKTHENLNEDIKKFIAIKNSVDLREKVITQQFQRAVNEIFDKTLEQYRNTARTTGKISIKLGRLEKNFTMTFFRYEVHGRMHLSDGKLKDLSTLYRSGNVTTETDNEYLNFTVPLVIKNMTIDFDYCEVSFMHFTKRGTAKANVGHNLITVQVAVPLLQACSIHLNRVELTGFSKLTIDMSGLGLLDNFHKRVANLIMADHTKKYKDSIEKHLSSVLRNVFESNDLLISLMNLLLDALAGN